jgi:hypothetical protein
MNVAFPQADRTKRWVLLLIGAMLCLRLAHVHLLWADEDYHLAAALQMLHGKVPYRDFWYDKPPLSAFYYLLIAGHAGWPLRLLDAAYLAVACSLTFQLAKYWWTRKEGWVAAGLLAFFTTFYLPSAVIPFAADALMLVPHLAAVFCAQRKLPLWSGIWAGVAFLANAKALFVLATCALWLPADLFLLAAGFVIPSLGGLLAAAWAGAWSGYAEQVWRWGLTYTSNSPVAHPLLNGTVRTLDWLGFHAALAAGAVFGWLRLTPREHWRMGVWLVLSFAAVSLGSRFAPHYFLQLLPVLVLLGSRGIVAGWQERRRVTTVVVSLLLLVPLVRFGPRYVLLASDDWTSRPPQWVDVGMDLDSQEVARQIRALARPGDTLFVWGYRPDIYVYTRMVSPGLFWDSQPLTGVPADRHLSANGSIFDAPAASANRRQLIRSSPTWIVDGLGLLNPRLSPAVYPELKDWLSRYQVAGRTKLSLIYRRR